jgi:hypothetical protein
MACAFCGTSIADTEVMVELNCGKHLAHGTHMAMHCPVPGCGAPHAVQSPLSGTPAVRTATAQQQQQQRKIHHVSAEELAAREQRIQDSVGRRVEPLCPPERSTIGEFFGSVLRLAGRVREANIPDDESSDPYALLRAKVPLTELVKKHGFDITELINDHGVTIVDFVSNGYTIGEMCNAFGSRMNPVEGMDVLYYLGMTDEFFTAVPDLVQVPVMRQRLGYTPQALIDKFGYRFCPGKWTLPQMLDAGLNMALVMQCGMRSVQEWHQLRATATSMKELAQFGVTPELEGQLIDDSPPAYQAYQQQAQPQPQPQPSPQQSVASVQVEQPVVVQAPAQRRPYTHGVARSSPIPIAPFQPLPPPSSYAKPKVAAPKQVTEVPFVPASLGPQLRQASTGPRLVERTAPVGGPVFLVVPRK